MSEELKRCIEDAVYKYVKEQIDEGKFTANLRIEIDNPIEIRGMKGRVVGEILLGERGTLSYSVPVMRQQVSQEKDSQQDQPKKGEDMGLQEVDKLLRSLGV